MTAETKEFNGVSFEVWKSSFRVSSPIIGPVLAFVETNVEKTEARNSQLQRIAELVNEARRQEVERYTAGLQDYLNGL